jgi:hypothetical protein
MLSDRIAKKIESSLARGERFEDFAYLFGSLMLARRHRRPHDNVEVSQEVAGKILCVLAPDKPPRYISVMQGFRLVFAGVSTDRKRKAEFWHCIQPAAITVSRPEDIVWRPSLYFSRPPSDRQLEDWF